MRGSTPSRAGTLARQERTLAVELDRRRDLATVRKLELTSPVAALILVAREIRHGRPAYDTVDAPEPRDVLRVCENARCGLRFWAKPYGGANGEQRFCCVACRVHWGYWNSPGRRERKLAQQAEVRAQRRAVAA